MENRTPLFLLVVAIISAAILGAGRMEQASPKQQATSPANPQIAGVKEKAQPGFSPSATLEAQCLDAPPPLRPLCEYFYALNDPKDTKIQNWWSRPWVDHAQNKIHFLIALVSDPEKTRDLLRFDLTVESIQSAAESVEFTFSRYWIPWTPQSSEDQKSKELEKPKEEPGILLFCKRSVASLPEVLVVFLVGESPLTGINGVMFQNALYYQDLLTRSPSLNIYVSGPNYTGTFPSLAKSIADAEKRFPQVARHYEVISPSATVKSVEDNFRRWSRGKVVYDSAIHNGDYAIQQNFQSYVRDRWGYSDDFAVLSESGTAFGSYSRISDPKNKSAQLSQDRQNQPQASQKAPANSTGLRIQFPRQISRLRNAYPDPTRDIMLRDEAIQFSPENRKLPVPMKDTLIGKDSVPTFSAKQIPVSQEAILLEIASLLQREKTAFINIVSSDVFDSIFLCSYLRRACPEARLFQANADLLFVRAVATQPLEGILSVTTFPLFLRNQLWSPRRNDAAAPILNPMSNRMSFGVYNACLALLKKELNIKVPMLLEYDWQNKGYENNPPLWLTVIGTNGYWPIALLDTPKDEDSLLLKSPTTRASGVPQPGTPTALWHYLFWSLIWISIIIFLSILLAQMIPEKAPIWIHRLLAGLKVAPTEDEACGRAFFLLAGSTFLGLMVFILASPVWMLESHNRHPWWIWIDTSMSAVVLCLSIAAGIFPFIVLVRHQGLTEFLKDWYLYFRLFCGVFAFGFVWIWWKDVLGSGSHLEGFFFAYRSLDLVNGVSPGLPLLLLASVILLLSILHARRHALYLKTPEELPKLGSTETNSSIAKYVKNAAEPLKHPMLSKQGKGYLLLAAGLSIVLFLPYTMPLSLESRGYDILYHVSLRLVIIILVLSWARFLLSWSSLRRLLDLLERHPLKEAFSRIPTICDTSPILPGKGSHFIEDSICATSRILESFLRQPLAIEYRNQLNVIRTDLDAAIERYLAEDAVKRAPDTGTLKSIYGLHVKAGDLIVPELEKDWKDRYAEAAKPKKETKGSAEKTVAITAVSRGEEFVALQYASFVGLLLKQLRNLLYFFTTGYFLVIVSTLVYPFRSSYQFMWVETVAFLILGAPVVVALVQVETNEGLKRLTAREKGNISRTLLRLATYGALPLLGLIGSHFPALGSYLVSLLQPAVQALR
jgi:hypothetical protein